MPFRSLQGGLAAAGAFLLLGVAPVDDPSVDYRVTPVFKGGALQHLAVEMRLRGDADGVTRLNLSDWGREPNPWSKVGGFQAPGADIVQADARVRVLRHPPGAPLTVRYQVLSAHTEDPRPETINDVFRPVIRPGWFAVYGETVFAVPEGRERSPARFRWGAAPRGWRLLSDLDHPDPRTTADTLDSFLLGAPDLRVEERIVLGGPLRLVFRGRWPFSDAAFADRIAEVAEPQRRFWNDQGQAFFVPMLGLPGFEGDPGGSVSNGTGRGDGYVMWGTPNLDLEDLTAVLAHEQLHTWIGRGLGDQSPTAETAGKWLNEGFADFYAGRLLLRGGLWTPEQFAADVNARLARYAASPARSTTNAQIAERYWSDEAHERMGYDRGMLFAALLDHELRRRSGGRLDLDDVMLAQFARAKTDPRAGRDLFAVDLFPLVWRETAGFDIADLLARHIERGDPILLPPDIFGDCGRMETVVQPDFHRGFDLQATQKAGVLTGVRPDSPAYAAGLRDGMKLLKREPSPVNDPAVEIGYRVLDDGRERLVRYLPAGRERHTLQRMILVPAGDPAACARFMSGA